MAVLKGCIQGCIRAGSLIALMFVAACSGGDKKDSSAATATATAPVSTGAASAGAGASPSVARTPAARASGSPVAVATGDCLKGLTSYRYTGKVSFKAPQVPGLAGANAAQSGDALFSGTFVAPDRTGSKVTFGNDTFELVAIGKENWIRQNGAAWQKSDENPGADLGIGPDTFCRIGAADLDRTGVRPVADTVNGQQALRYDFSKQDLGKLDTIIDGAAGLATNAMDNVKLSVWVTDKERWPARISLAGDQKIGSEALTLTFEANVTDYNRSDIVVEPPA